MLRAADRRHLRGVVARDRARWHLQALDGPAFRGSLRQRSAGCALLAALRRLASTRASGCASRRHRHAAERLSALALDIGSWPAARARPRPRRARTDEAARLRRDALSRSADSPVVAAPVRSGLAGQVALALARAATPVASRRPPPASWPRSAPPDSIEPLHVTLADQSPDVAYAAAQALANYR